MNCGLCVVGGFDQAGIVIFLLKKCVINYINGDLGEPACFSLNWSIFKLTGNGKLP